MQVVNIFKTHTIQPIKKLINSNKEHEKGWAGLLFFKRKKIFWLWSSNDVMAEAVNRGDKEKILSLLDSEIKKGWDPERGVVGYRRHNMGGDKVCSWPLCKLGEWLQSSKDQGEKGLMFLIDQLVKRGADPSQCGRSGPGGLLLQESSAFTLLGHVLGVQTQKVLPARIVKDVLSLGGGFKISDYDYYDPLWLCVFAENKEESLEVAILLLEAGADPFAVAPKKIAPETLRYSSSPLKYSSEKGKDVWQVATERHQKLAEVLWSWREKKSLESVESKGLQSIASLKRL